jgi:hypothetical protein
MRSPLCVITCQKELTILDIPSWKEKMKPNSLTILFARKYINFLHPKIELVRNNFVFENLAYDSINEVVLSDGYLIKNRWLIRTLSIIAIYLTAKFLFFGITVSGGIEHWNLAQWFNKGSLIGVWDHYYL